MQFEIKRHDGADVRNQGFKGFNTIRFIFVVIMGKVIADRANQVRRI